MALGTVGRPDAMKPNRSVRIPHETIQVSNTSLQPVSVLCRRWAIVVLVAGWSLLGGRGVEAETVYRFEENGRTIYQDRAPSSRQDDGHSVLNHQGVVLRQVQGREERRRERLREREAELARIRDRALLATFTTESDLIRTRDDRVGMIDGLISRLDDRIRILSDRLDVVDRRIVAEEANGAKARASLYAERRSVQRNIENAWSLIDAKATERRDLEEKFALDLERYRELKQPDVSRSH